MSSPTSASVSPLLKAARMACGENPQGEGTKAVGIITVSEHTQVELTLSLTLTLTLHCGGSAPVG